MYTFDGIILEKHILREKQIRIVTLTKEYGKVTLWSHKNLTGTDIGDIARFIVKRNNSINHIKSIETKYYLLHKKWNYKTLISFLYILKIFKICTAEADNIPELFLDYENTMKSSQITVSEDFCHLFQMRIFKYLGLLNPQFFKNDTILRYIYQKINQTPLERIINTQPLKNTHKNIIEKSNLLALSTFL